MLRKSQSHFMQALYLQENAADNAGLAIYQRSLIANAVRALSITFSTVHSYIGDAAFTQLVTSYLRAEPKTEYDWGEYGASFPSFISTQSIRHATVLTEIATLDFACHQAERAKDVDVNLHTLNLLNSEDPYNLVFQFNAGLKLITSHMPLLDIKQTITQQANDNNITNVNDISQVLSQYMPIYEKNVEQQTPFYFVIWRPDFQANFTQITQGEFQWLTTLLTQKNGNDTSIGEALDLIDNETFSLIDWLPNAISERLICGIQFN